MTPQEIINELELYPNSSLSVFGKATFRDVSNMIKELVSKKQPVNPIPNGDRPASEMTKREMIAAIMASGIVNTPDVPVHWAIESADELLEELKKKETK